MFPLYLSSQELAMLLSPYSTVGLAGQARVASSPRMHKPGIRPGPQAWNTWLMPLHYTLLVSLNKQFGKDVCSPGKRTLPVLIYRLPDLTNNV